MTLLFSKILRTTTVLVCAVVVLLCLGHVSITRAQEDTATSTPEAVPAQSVTPSGYTTEFIDDVAGVVAGDFVVGPGKSELTIEPGQSKRVEMMITNRTGDTREFQFEIEDASGSTDPTTPVVLLGDDTGPYTLKDYIQLPVETIELDHNERARIMVTVSVPADAEPGGRYGSVLVTTLSRKAEAGDTSGAAPSSAIVSRVGTLFFLTIPGDTLTEGALQDFATVGDKHIYTEGPVNFQILFENTGDLHLNPYGEIRITNMFGEEVSFIELDPWFSLPQSLRSREVSWDRELLVGKYTATAQINRGYDDIIDTQSLTFWVLPWKVVVPIFVGLFLLFFLIRFISKNFEFKRKGS